MGVATHIGEKCQRQSFSQTPLLPFLIRECYRPLTKTARLQQKRPVGVESIPEIELSQCVVGKHDNLLICNMLPNAIVWWAVCTSHPEEGEQMERSYSRAGSYGPAETKHAQMVWWAVSSWCTQIAYNQCLQTVWGVDEEDPPYCLSLNSTSQLETVSWWMRETWSQCFARAMWKHLMCMLRLLQAAVTGWFIL